MTTHLIVGTAGHIDHGKTALVKALTGVDADRLPEEKRRGMTVDLGFALLELEGFCLSIVDVPGHERFIRNMLAGAMAVDVAMLVVAATESIKPQTREHLEILKHAAIEQGVVVLTKCDLASPDWIELVEQEVRELVAESFLHTAPLVQVSATTGAGLPTLRQALASAAERAAHGSRRPLVDAPFCLGVDRAFSVAGHGTIVTGSVASGRLQVGDELMIAPSGKSARVRSLQSYNLPVQSVQRGQRAAINLAGISLSEIRRGDVLAQNGLLCASHCLCARLAVDAEHRGQRRSGLPVRIHVGTAEIQAELRWLERPQDDQEMIAELRTEQPVACLAGQPVVVRSRSAAVTLGGGRVLDPDFRPGVRWSAADLQQLHQLASPDPLQRLAAALYLNDMAGFDEPTLARRTGLEPPPSTLRESLVQWQDAVSLQLGDGRQHLVHAEVLAAWSRRIEQLLNKQHQQHPLQAAFPRSVLQKMFAPLATAGLPEAIIRFMEQAGRLVVMPAGLALPGHAPQLSKAQQRHYTRILQAHREAAYAPPSLDQLVAAMQTPRESVGKLVELAIAQGHLVRVCAEWCLHWENDRELRRILRTQLDGSSFAVNELRDLLHTSRKYLVPLCEHLDRSGFTKREGNLRRIVAGQPPQPQECGW